MLFLISLQENCYCMEENSLQVGERNLLIRERREIYYFLNESNELSKEVDMSIYNKNDSTSTTNTFINKLIYNLKKFSDILNNHFDSLEKHPSCVGEFYDSLFSTSSSAQKVITKGCGDLGLIEKLNEADGNMRLAYQKNSGIVFKCDAFTSSSEEEFNTEYDQSSIDSDSEQSNYESDIEETKNNI